MKVLWLALLFVSGGVASPVVVESLYSEEDCEDIQQIAQDYLELELSGFRWQGGESSCLKGLKLKTWPVHQEAPVADPALRRPGFLIPDDRPADVSVRRLPGDRLELKVHYIGKKGVKEVTVRDSAILRLHFGKVRETRGCASVYQPLEHFVMRRNCQ
jgi:hypothetical protein